MSALLSLQNVTMRFGGLVALNQLDFQVARGSIHALIGPNGAGKSTLLNCISRFCTPQQGSIMLDGENLMKHQAHGVVRAGIGRTFQNIEQVHRMTVIENILVGLTPRMGRYVPFLPGRLRRAAETVAVKRAEEILDQLGLLAFKNSLAGELDFGRQKMLDFGRALASEPKLLLLDEPAAGLRNREIQFLDDFLLRLRRERGLTILLVEHVMQLVMSVADRVTVLNFGEKIADGEPEDIKRDDAVIEAYLGREAEYA